MASPLRTPFSTQVDLSIIDEEHLSEAPRVLRGVSVYLNDKDEIIAYLLADYLRNN